ncbi:hypothetical protein ACET3Z_015391 [Daucus carota]
MEFALKYWTSFFNSAPLAYMEGTWEQIVENKFHFNTPNFHNFLSVFPRKPIGCSMKSCKLSDLTQTEINDLSARARIDFSSIFCEV